MVTLTMMPTSLRVVRICHPLFAEYESKARIVTLADVRRCWKEHHNTNVDSEQADEGIGFVVSAVCALRASPSSTLRSRDCV